MPAQDLAEPEIALFEFAIGLQRVGLRLHGGAIASLEVEHGGPMLSDFDSFEAFVAVLPA